MKKTIALLIGLAGFCAPAAAHAQVTMDMTKVTCADYLAMPSDVSRDFSAWMSGWFNQKNNDATINVAGYMSNVANVQKWCASNPKESVFAGLQRAVPKAKEGVGGPVDVDAAQFTCKQLLDADPDRQMLVQAWMGGWFSSTKNITTLDIRYVNRNEKVVMGYCKKNKKANLMTAIQKNWK
jgi:hypothetical protein